MRGVRNNEYLIFRLHILTSKASSECFRNFIARTIYLLNFIIFVSAKSFLCCRGIWVSLRRRRNLVHKFLKRWLRHSIIWFFIFLDCKTKLPDTDGTRDNSVIDVVTSFGIIGIYIKVCITQLPFQVQSWYESFPFFTDAF